MFWQAQASVLGLIWLVFLVLKAWAFLDCLRRPSRAFPAIGRQNKGLWVALTGVSVLTGLLFDPVGLVGIAGIIVALVYLFDLRPRMAELTWRR
ncbi:MAG: DUF2516 family protein [Candidatus Nanopelagicales bacterium]|nr:DUF2516 family protein [Candidatus Nanopelagicales bacterium]